MTFEQLNDIIINGGYRKGLAVAKNEGWVISKNEQGRYFAKAPEYLGVEVQLYGWSEPFKGVTAKCLRDLVWLIRSEYDYYEQRMKRTIQKQIYRLYSYTTNKRLT